MILEEMIRLLDCFGSSALVGITPNYIANKNLLFLIELQFVGILLRGIKPEDSTDVLNIQFSRSIINDFSILKNLDLINCKR